MLSSLASLLFLGIVPAVNAVASPSRLPPGIEVMRVAAPTSIVDQFTLPQLSASGVMVVDLKSGEVIASREPDTKRSIASLTKMMTALLILEQGQLGRTVTVPPITDNIGGSTIGLKSGEQITLDALLKAALIASANDAAYAAAVTSKGNVAAFVHAMNERARSLNLRSTRFANPAGLDHAEQYSTPRDIAWLAKAALRHETFRSIVNTRGTTVRSLGGTEYHLRNTNEMLHFNPSVHGVKTGTTNGAGECLVLLAEEAGREYLIVLLGSGKRYDDALRVLNALKEAHTTP